MFALVILGAHTFFYENRPMNYPYGLSRNPYPSSPTPTEKDAQILGGTRHIQAKESILECITDLYRQSSKHQSNDNDFRLITVIQDVGCGKTHLALHIDRKSVV